MRASALFIVAFPAEMLLTFNTPVYRVSLPEKHMVRHKRHIVRLAGIDRPERHRLPRQKHSKQSKPPPVLYFCLP
jgi:hypothetical protein